jgi:hypothetical protein
MAIVCQEKLTTVPSEKIAFARLFLHYLELLSIIERSLSLFSTKLLCQGRNGQYSETGKNQAGQI